MFGYTVPPKTRAFPDNCGQAVPRNKQQAYCIARLSGFLGFRHLYLGHYWVGGIMAVIPTLALIGAALASAANNQSNAILWAGIGAVVCYAVVVQLLEMKAAAVSDPDGPEYQGSCPAGLFAFMRRWERWPGG